jgi:mono/diheme cytochrome c family protein
MKWVALNVLTLIGSAAFVALPVVAEDAPPKSAVMSSGWEFGEQGGADLFRNVCAACHQADARGAVGAGAYPALASNGKLAASDFVLTVLLRGLDGMPPVGGMMSDAQVANVINYVRTHFGNSYSDGVSAADVSAARRRLTTP